MCWLAQAACSLFTLNPSPAYLPFLWSPLTGPTTDLNEKTDVPATDLPKLSSVHCKCECPSLLLSSWFTKLPFSRHARESKWLDRISFRYHFAIQSKSWQRRSVTLLTMTWSSLCLPVDNHPCLLIHQSLIQYFHWREGFINEHCLTSSMSQVCQWVRNTERNKQIGVSE